MGLSTASISWQVPLFFSNFSMAIQEGQVNNKSVEYFGCSYCKPWNFRERFIFAILTNALSNTNLKRAKISTLMHFNH
jgi:hypothetical protein